MLFKVLFQNLSNLPFCFVKEVIYMKKTIAIITARGGSKRIPKKNIKEFCGKPIIEYSIKAAIDTGIFHEIMVSTDDEEIGNIAKAAGANVPFYRSEKTSDDYATTADVLMEVVDEYEKRGKKFDTIVCLYPTAPFITANKIIEAMKVFEDNNASMVLPVVPFSFPPLRGNIIDEDGKLLYKWPEFRNTRSQDLETLYHDCGQFSIVDVKELRLQNGTITEGIYPYILSELEVQDIDNEIDWQMAELKYQFMLKR